MQGECSSTLLFLWTRYIFSMEVNKLGLFLLFLGILMFNSCASDEPRQVEDLDADQADSVNLSIEQQFKDSIAGGISPQEVLAQVNFSNADEEYFDTFSYGYAQSLALAVQDLGKKINQEEFLDGFDRGIAVNTSGLEILNATMSMEIRRGVEAGFTIPESLKKYENNKSLSYNFGLDAGNKLKQFGFPVERIHLPSFKQALCQEVDIVAAKKNLEKSTKTFEEVGHYTLSVREKEHQEYLTKNAERPEVTELKTRVQYEILQEGTGKQPTIHTINTVHFEGRMIDGRLFDSSIERGEPITFKLDDMIEGWKEVLPLMKEGGKWRVVVPPTSGYGKVTYGIVPPYSVLVFDLELLKVE